MKISQMNKKFIKEQKDNEIIQHKYNNENNHNDVQTRNITIIDYFKKTLFFLLSKCMYFL